MSGPRDDGPVVLHLTGAALAAAVWEALEAIPGFNEQLRVAEAELDRGGGVLYEVVLGRLRRVGTDQAPQSAGKQ
jgi:hypothetical protein